MQGSTITAVCAQFAHNEQHSRCGMRCTLKRVAVLALVGKREGWRKKKEEKKSSTSTLDVQQHLDLHSWPASVPLGSIAFAVWQQCPRNMWQWIWTLVQQEKLKTGVQLSSFRVVQQTSRDESLSPIRISKIRTRPDLVYIFYDYS